MPPSSLMPAIGWTEGTLGASARGLVGFVFLFATIWKIVLGQYVDGEFLYWTLLTDPRVERLAATVAGVGTDTIVAFRQSVGHLGVVGQVGIELPVLSSDRLWSVARAVSWLTLAVEGAIALTWLFPTMALYNVRHTLLLIFVAITYFVLPVPGFAFTLIILGIAAVEREDTVLRTAYAAMLALTQLALVPWQFLLPGGGVGG